MGRLLAFLLGAAALGYAAYVYVSGQRDFHTADAAATSAPKKTLDNARQAAHRIEDDSQKRADDL
jgi:hypothetical protein